MGKVTKKRTELCIPCTNCRTPTTHKIQREFEVKEYDEYAGIGVCNTHFIAQCMGCKSVSFVREHTCSEDWEPHPFTGEPECRVTRILFPSRLEGRQLIGRAKYIPDPVFKIHQETFQAIVEKMPILAGIGIRAIIETVSKEKGAKGKNLEKKIDSLVEMGCITNEGGIILHSLRFLGNAAAHDTKAHSEEELETALDVVEHLLNSVYILPCVAKKLPPNKKP